MACPAPLDEAASGLRRRQKDWRRWAGAGGSRCSPMGGGAFKGVQRGKTVVSRLLIGRAREKCAEAPVCEPVSVNDGGSKAGSRSHH